MGVNIYKLIKSKVSNKSVATHKVRKWSNDELRKVAKLFHGSICNVSGWEDKDKEGGYYGDYFVNKTSYSLTNYEIGHRYSGDELEELTLDLTKDLPKRLQSRFDVVFNHTTLEHIFDVTKAFKNLCLMSKDIVIVVVPFVQQQHEAPQYNFKDYWRFTPSCIRRLFEINGMQAIYESFTNAPGEVNYLFFIGSKNPKKWEKKMPTYEELSEICNWVS